MMFDMMFDKVLVHVQCIVANTENLAQLMRESLFWLFIVFLVQINTIYR